MLQVWNITEIMVEAAIRELLAGREHIGECEICLADVGARALNNLPTQYVRSEKGRAIKQAGTMDQAFTAQVWVEVERAIADVNEHPHCARQEEPVAKN